MVQRSNEKDVILALQALENDKNLSVRAVAKIYNVSHTILYRRRVGRPSRRDTTANSRKLTDLEEHTIVQYITNLYTRSFPPRLRNVEDMANQLLRARDAPSVGKNWASNFVQRQPELKTRFNRVYDFRRALYEDPELIGAWF